MTTIVNPGFEEMRCDGSGQLAKEDYNHQAVMAEIDKINKDLQQLKDGLVSTSVRCHILEVELATQFSPYMVAAVKNAKEDCTKCCETVRNYVDSAQMELSEPIP